MDQSTKITLFKYNWVIREEWFRWCKQLSSEALSCERIGGLGDFLQTLFHIVDVEQRWIARLRGDKEIRYSFDDYNTLEKIMELSCQHNPLILQFIKSYNEVDNKKKLTYINRNGKEVTYFYGEIIPHIIAHEIHHIGQLSVWAREVCLTPISANVIGLNLVK